MSSQSTYPDFVRFGYFLISRREFSRVTCGCICYNSEDFNFTLLLDAGKSGEIIEKKLDQSELPSKIKDIENAIASFNKDVGEERFVYIGGGLFFAKSWIQQNGIELHNLNDPFPSSRSKSEIPGHFVFTLNVLPLKCGKVVVHNTDPKSFHETVRKNLTEHHPDWIVAGETRFIANSTKWFSGIRFMDFAMTSGGVIYAITDGMNDTITLRTTMAEFRAFNLEFDAAIIKALGTKIDT